MVISNEFDKVLQFAHECFVNTTCAVKGYAENSNLSVSMQFMNQAFICAKQVQNLYYEVKEHEQTYQIEQFYHQFLFVNQELLEAIQSDHDLQHSLIELENLKDRFDDMQKALTI
jgi:hypothetical protein